MTGSLGRSSEFIGLIPAAGQAVRLGTLPCSKEVYPIGFPRARDTAQAAPKAVSQYLLEKMQRGGVARAYIVLRSGKWDIPGYFGDGSSLNLPLAYLTISSSAGVPFTLDYAYPFVRDAEVAFGFPDLLFDPDDAFVRLFTHKAASGADVVLGLCRKNNTPTNDLVDCDATGAVRELRLGVLDETLKYSWAVATWGPAFTEFLHEFTGRRRHLPANSAELSVGHAMNEAIKSGLAVQSTVLSEMPYLDIGTPAGLAEALRRAASPAPSVHSVNP